MQHDRKVHFLRGCREVVRDTVREFTAPYLGFIFINRSKEELCRKKGQVHFLYW